VFNTLDTATAQQYDDRSNSTSGGLRLLSAAVAATTHTTVNSEQFFVHLQQRNGYALL
jgi:hypothetical protein